MDTNAIVAIVIGAVVVLAIFAVVAGKRFRKGSFKGPGGLEGSVEADQGPQRGATGRNVRGKKNVNVTDLTGHQATGEDITAEEGDVNITVSGPGSKGSRPNP